MSEIAICATSGEGNTNSSPHSKGEFLYWSFTIFYEDTDYNNIIATLETHFIKFIVGREICPTTNKKHLQGWGKLKKKKRFSSVQKILKGIHIEKSISNEEDNERYCSKGGDYFKFGFPPEIKIITSLRPFQQSLLNIILGPVMENKVIWIYDPIGQLGKTEFLRYCFVKYNIPFTFGGKCSDIINLVFNCKEYLLNTDKACFIYNLGRADDLDKVSYKSMEQISDGCISNNKFETGCFVCNKPHIVVLANGLPKLSCLTSSRWLIYTITNYELIPYTMSNDLDI